MKVEITIYWPKKKWALSIKNKIWQYEYPLKNISMLLQLYVLHSFSKAIWMYVKELQT